MKLDYPALLESIKIFNWII